MDAMVLVISTPPNNTESLHLQWRHNERLTIIYPTVYSGTGERKYQSSASLAFVIEIHRWPGTNGK